MELHRRSSPTLIISVGLILYCRKTFRRLLEANDVLHHPTLVVVILLSHSGPQPLLDCPPQPVVLIWEGARLAHFPVVRCPHDQLLISQLEGWLLLQLFHSEFTTYIYMFTITLHCHLIILKVMFRFIEH